MNKQEEIREGITKVIYTDWGVSKWENLTDAEKDTWYKTVAKIMDYLHLQETTGEG